MSQYTSNISLTQAADIIKQMPQPIAVVTHAKPDGDALGSVLAITQAIRVLDIDVQGYLVPPIPQNFDVLPGFSSIQAIDSPDALANAASFLLLDTGAKSQVAFTCDTLVANADNLMIIDHHLSGDIPAKHRYIDSNAGACAEIIYELANILTADLTLDSQAKNIINSAIFTGIVSDTGWFRFSNTRPVTHRIAADLIEQGIDHAELFQKLEQTERPEKLKLLIRAIDSLELLLDNRVAIMSLSLEDFAETGAYEEETERIVDIPQKVATVQLVVLVSEKRDIETGETIARMSFRSKPGPNAVDVAQLASHFGGGGHARAAGAKLTGTIHDLLPDIKRTLSSALLESTEQ
ncbi:DHH family phosphoesterase [Poriferisphaera sp. WC338]|uniref:DHH family phosphoesterase n=1 Tax=Poriferisphaera sp. WC338 TaxID=3425129 RepID=UPI003D8148BD